MSEELTVMTREELENQLAPTEGLSHVDVDLGTAADVHFHLPEPNAPVVVRLQGQEYPLTDNGLWESARGVHIPRAFSTRCPTELLLHNLNYLYGHTQNGRLRFFVKNGEVIGSYTNRPRYFSNLQVVDQISQMVGDEHILGFHQVNTNLAHSRVAIVTDRTHEVVTGDTLYGGIEFQNSVLGKHQIQITPYIFRQYCSNGAIVSESIGSFSRRGGDEEDDSGDIGPWVRTTTQEALNSLGREFDRIQRLTGVSVEGHVTETLASIFRKFRIPVRIQTEITEEAAAQHDGAGPSTMYDVWNAITRVATHSERLTPVTGRGLQFIAGEVTQEYNLCPSCHQLVNGGDHSHGEG